MKNILNLITEDTYVISDHHFHHKNINKFEPIRLKRAKELKYNNTEKMMIDKWNEVVKPTDTVLHLGDFAFAYVKDYVDKLNGTIIFIFGNHDKKSSFNSYYNLKGFYIQDGKNYILNFCDRDVLHSGLIKEFNGKRIMFCHYPLEYDDPYDKQKEKIVNRLKRYQDIYKEYKCDYLIHGHVHTKEKNVPNHFNTSCESLDFKPIQIKEILKKI